MAIKATFSTAWTSSRRRRTRLTSTSRIPEVDVNRVRLRRLDVHAVENVALIAMVVHFRELRAVEKPPGVHAAGGNKITPGLPTVCHVETTAAGAEGPIGTGQL